MPEKEDRTHKPYNISYEMHAEIERLAIAHEGGNKSAMMRRIVLLGLEALRQQTKDGAGPGKTPG